MLNRWHRLSLQVKITLIIICIVGLSAVTTEWLEARSIQHTVEDNVRDAAGLDLSQSQALVPLSCFSSRTRGKRGLVLLFCGCARNGGL